AAYNGDVERVKQLIAKGADVNAKRTNGKTPLLRAASRGHLDVVKVLLENGAKVDVGGGKYTPLFHPIWDKNIDIEMVRTLIASGADVNAHPKDEKTTPLFYAVFYNRPQVARILIEAGADVNTRTEDGLTPLHIALRRANAEMARQFAGTGVKVPALHNAVLEGDLTKVKGLIESATDVDTPDEFGWTPTCWAVSTGQEEVAKYLLNQGADVSAKIENGRTLLHQASRTGLLEVVKSLIAKGAEVDAKCEVGATALQYAALSGREAVVKLLIANGATINFTAKDGTHPLGDAARSGHKDVVKLLLASGAQVNLQPEDKMRCGTALHAAAAGAHSTIIDILIAHGADVNAVYKGGTPLNLAANYLDSRTSATENRRAQIVQKLLDYGADIDAKHPRSGATPLYDAIDLGRWRTAEVLITAGADVNAANNEGKTPLSHAKGWGRNDITELLRKHGAKE
ncbi:MAG: ankyrin repeat domain-containing protein, partial [Planctomycetota bacterium]